MTSFPKEGVSKKLKSVRDEITLFSDKSKSKILTREGRLLIRSVNRLLEDIESFSKNIEEEKNRIDNFNDYDS